MDGDCTIHTRSFSEDELLIAAFFRRHNLIYKKVTICYIKIKLSKTVLDNLRVATPIR